MNLREGVKQALLANAALLAIIGQQIFANFAPQGAAGTWIVITKISAQETGAHDGDGNLQQARYQFSIGGEDKEAIDLAQNILIQQFNCFEFTYTESAIAHVLTFFHEDDRDIWDEVTRTYLTTVDLTVWSDH